MANQFTTPYFLGLGKGIVWVRLWLTPSYLDALTSGRLDYGTGMVPVARYLGLKKQAACHVRAF